MAAGVGGRKSSRAGSRRRAQARGRAVLGGASGGCSGAFARSSEDSGAEPEGRDPILQELEHQGRFAGVADSLALSDRLADAGRLAVFAGCLTWLLGFLTKSRAPQQSGAALLSLPAGATHYDSED